MTHSSDTMTTDSDNPYQALGEVDPFAKVKVTDSTLFTAPVSQTQLFSSNYFTQRLNSEPVVMWLAQKSINSSMLTVCLEVLLWTICLVSPFYCKLRLECMAAFKAQISLDLQYFCFFFFSTYSQWDFYGEIGPLSTKHDTCVGVCWCANSHNGCNRSKT